MSGVRALRLVFGEKLLDAQRPEIAEHCAQSVVRPIPPGKPLQARSDFGGKTRAQHPRRIADRNRISRDVLGHHGAGADHRAGADHATRQHNGAVADPDVMTDGHVIRPPPGKELIFILRAVEISAGAVGKMRLGRTMHRVVAGVDPGHRRDRGELADGRVGDVAIVHDIRVIAERHLLQLGARADFGVGAERHLSERCSRIDHRNCG